jgi:hypothetical protein
MAAVSVSVVGSAIVLPFWINDAQAARIHARLGVPSQLELLELVHGLLTWAVRVHAPQPTEEWILMLIKDEIQKEVA